MKLIENEFQTQPKRNATVDDVIRFGVVVKGLELYRRIDFMLSRQVTDTLFGILETVCVENDILLVDERDLLRIPRTLVLSKQSLDAFRDIVSEVAKVTKEQ